MHHHSKFMVVFILKWFKINYSSINGKIILNILKDNITFKFKTNIEIYRENKIIEILRLI